MKMNRSSTVDVLLSFCSFVFEISEDGMVHEVWAKDASQQDVYAAAYKNKYTHEVHTGFNLNSCMELVKKSIATGESNSLQYDTTIDGKIVKQTIRILPTHTNKSRVYLVKESNISISKDELLEDKWKLALDASGDGMWDADIPSGKIYFSEKWQEIFGGSHDGTDTTSAHWAAKLHPDDVVAAQQKFDAYINGETPQYSAELRYKTKDGSYRWILSRGVAVSWTADKKPLRFIGTHTDIHERKLNEIQLQRSEAQYKDIFNFSEAMICTHDIDGKIISINPSTSKSLGYTPEEMQGQFISSLLPKSKREEFHANYMRSIHETGNAAGVMQIITKNGDIKFLLYHNYLFNDRSEHAYVIGFAQDITSRINAEEALKTSVDTFSSAFNHSATGMALVSPEGKWLDVNNALCGITGYSKDELLKITFQDITYPDDLNTDLDYLKRILNGELKNYTLEKRYVSKDKKIIWILLNVSLIRNADGTPKFFVSQITDITKKKTLTDEINRKNAELEATRVSLVGKINQLEELNYIVAHNLRGPAGNIKMLAEALKAKEDPTNAGENAAYINEAFTTKEAIDLINEGSTSLMNNLETLMKLAQIRLKKDITYDECSVQQIIDAIISQLHGMIYEKRAVVKLNLAIKHISYPKVYLESILYNLISNALKYSSKTENPEIIISTHQNEGKISLSVKDNGLGIDLDKYGDKVFKLNQVFHYGYDSKGVGLYMTKTQIESLGGTIEVRSEVDKGSEFTVML